MTPTLHTQTPPLPLGEFLRAAGLILQPQLDAALNLQRSSGAKIGVTLQHEARLDPKDVDAALEIQRQVREHLSSELGAPQHALPDCLRLGEMLVSRGDVSRDVLERALAQQQPNGMLGEALLQMGAVSADTLVHVLALQKRLLSAVLSAGLGFVFAFATPSAMAAGGGSANLMISATIAKSLQVVSATHPTSFLITPADIARGYLNVEQPSVIDIKTNSAQGVALEFHGADSGADIQNLIVSGGANEFTMSASGGIMLIQGPWVPTVTRSFRLKYRLMLGPNALTGSYAWPLSVSVSVL